MQRPKPDSKTLTTHSDEKLTTTTILSTLSLPKLAASLSAPRTLGGKEIPIAPDFPTNIDQKETLFTITKELFNDKLRSVFMFVCSDIDIIINLIWQKIDEQDLGALSGAIGQLPERPPEEIEAIQGIVDNNLMPYAKFLSSGFGSLTELEYSKLMTRTKFREYVARMGIQGVAEELIKTHPNPNPFLKKCVNEGFHALDTDEKKLLRAIPAMQDQMVTPLQRIAKRVLCAQQNDIVLQCKHVLGQSGEVLAKIIQENDYNIDAEELKKMIDTHGNSTTDPESKSNLVKYLSRFASLARIIKSRENEQLSVKDLELAAGFPSIGKLLGLHKIEVNQPKPSHAYEIDLPQLPTLEAGVTLPLVPPSAYDEKGENATNNLMRLG